MSNENIWVRATDLDLLSVVIYRPIITRKLSYCKDYRAMRPIWMPWTFSGVP